MVNFKTVLFLLPLASYAIAIPLTDSKTAKPEAPSVSVDKPEAQSNGVVKSEAHNDNTANPQAHSGIVAEPESYSGDKGAENDEDCPEEEKEEEESGKKASTSTSSEGEHKALHRRGCGPSRPSRPSAEEEYEMTADERRAARARRKGDNRRTHTQDVYGNQRSSAGYRNALQRARTDPDSIQVAHTSHRDYYESGGYNDERQYKNRRPTGTIDD